MSATDAPTLLDSLRKLASRLFDDDDEAAVVDAALVRLDLDGQKRLEQRLLPIAAIGKVDLGQHEFRAILPQPEGAALLVAPSKETRA